MAQATVTAPCKQGQGRNHCPDPSSLPPVQAPGSGKVALMQMRSHHARLNHFLLFPLAFATSTHSSVTNLDGFSQALDTPRSSLPSETCALGVDSGGTHLLPLGLAVSSCATSFQFAGHEPSPAQPPTPPVGPSVVLLPASLRVFPLVTSHPFFCCECSDPQGQEPFPQWSLVSSHRPSHLDPKPST